jgi:hypothetical protein
VVLVEQVLLPLMEQEVMGSIQFFQRLLLLVVEQGLAVLV